MLLVVLDLKGSAHCSALKSHGHYYNDDCKLSCYYHNHPSLHQGHRMHQLTHFETPKLKKFSGKGAPRSLPNGEGAPHSAPQFARLRCSTCPPPQTEMLDPPLSDTNRPDAAPIHLTVKPTIHVDGRPTDGQRLRMYKKC